MPKVSLNLRLSTFASPAATTSRAPSGVLNESVFAILAGITPSTAAASSTVAEEVENSRILSPTPKPSRYFLTVSTDMVSFLFELIGLTAQIAGQSILKQFYTITLL